MKKLFPNAKAGNFEYMIETYYNQVIRFNGTLSNAKDGLLISTTAERQAEFGHSNKVNNILKEAAKARSKRVFAQKLLFALEVFNAEQQGVIVI